MVLKVGEEELTKIGSLLNDANRPLKERFRALFTLKNIGGQQSIEQISKCFQDKSALLRHELAYCLGQMQDAHAIPVLIKVLENFGEEPMVRHEAAEALGAIGSDESLEILAKYRKDNTVEVAESVELALERVKWLQNPDLTSTENVYHSVDPAPPSKNVDVKQLKQILFDEHCSLWERYRAMFALRDLHSKEAIEILGQALDCGSCLFRHEIAFVLGQLQDEYAVPYLIKSLENKSQNAMVRHECAEALGAIATEECITSLKQHLTDESEVVKESCVVALDICDYENSPEFQYANSLLVSNTK